MKKLCAFWMLTSLLLLAGCSKGGDDAPVTQPTKPEPSTPSEPTNPDNGGGGGGEQGGSEGEEGKLEDVTFTASLAAMTRGSETAFSSGDRISVFAMKANPGDNRAIIAASGNYATNVQYGYNGSKFTATSTAIKNKTGQPLFYSAVYPYSAKAANAFDFDVNTNQSTEAAYSASMLCTATSAATDAKEVNLQFSHRMAKVVFNLSGNGWTGSSYSAKAVNVMTRANVNLNNQTFVGVGSKGEVTCAPNGNKSFKVMLPPQTLNGNEKLLVINMDGVDYALETTGTLDLQSGKSYDFTLNLTKTGEVVFFNGDINPWNEDERINSVIPEDIQDKMEPYIPIYHGANPPNIEGTVFVDPFTAVYCEDYGNGGYAPGHQVASEYIRFKNQDMVYNKIDMDAVSISGSSSESGSGAFISGTGNNFTVFFNTVGETLGINTKTALLISGTKTATGIVNLKYAFVMVEKGSDPANKLMRVGVFRVFEDQDGNSPYVTSWPGKAPRRNGQYVAPWTIYSNFK